MGGNGIDGSFNTNYINGSGWTNHNPWATIQKHSNSRWTSFFRTE